MTNKKYVIESKGFANGIGSSKYATERERRIKELKKEIQITELLERFAKNQSLTLIGELQKLGIGLKVLKNNEWQTLHTYKLPFERFIHLYNDDFKVCDLGIY